MTRLGLALTMWTSAAGLTVCFALLGGTLAYGLLDQISNGWRRVAELRRHRRLDDELRRLLDEDTADSGRQP